MGTVTRISESGKRPSTYRPVPHPRPYKNSLATLLERTVRTATGCLEWTGRRNKAGRGYISLNNHPRLVHRVVWELTQGPIPEGVAVYHQCKNPACCEPKHLFLGGEEGFHYGPVQTDRAGQPLYLWAIRSALARGYTVDVETGTVRNPRGEPLKISIHPATKYPRIWLPDPRNSESRARRTVGVHLHKVIAWQLWGEESVRSGIYVRHLDDNALNWGMANLALGTPLQNAQDYQENRHAVGGQNTRLSEEAS